MVAERVAEIGGAPDAAVLEGADEPEIGMFIEKRQGGEPRILENGDEWFAGSWLQRLARVP